MQNSSVIYPTETLRYPWKWILWAVIGISYWFFIYSLPDSRSTSSFQHTSQIQIVDSMAPALFESQFLPAVSKESHASTMATLSNGNAIAFWYGGTREGAKDVQIFSSRFNADSNDWSEAKVVVGRESTQASVTRYIRKIGNPVVFKAAENELWLFYVSVSVGGWAGSSINLTRSFDQGLSWGPAKRLVTSPFFNLSTLVRNSAFSYQDGTVALPVYHEFLGKFSELLLLDQDGEIVSKQRLSHGRYSLQPSITPIDDNRALGYMRYAGEEPGYILAFDSDNGGHKWSGTRDMTYPNPGSAVTSLKLANDQLLLAFNNDFDSRRNLSLATTTLDEHSQLGDGAWRIINHLEHAAPAVAGESDHDISYSYPWMMQSDDGMIHLLYTSNKSGIKHLRFNYAWLNQQSQL